MKAGNTSGMLFVAGLAGIMIDARPAEAVPLPDPVPPATFVDVPIPGTGEAARPELAGVMLEDVTKPYDFVSGVATIFGSVQTRVVRSNLDGTLDFYWRIIPAHTPRLAPIIDSTIDSFRVGGFGAIPLDADWRNDMVGMTTPITARNFGGGFVSYLFNGLGVGNFSNYFFLDTQATAYAAVGSYDFVYGGGSIVSGSVSTFAPVPETAAGLLAAMAAAGVAVLRRGQVISAAVD